MRRLFCITAMLILGAVILVAQEEAPRFEVLGAYSYLNADTSGLTDRFSLNGWNAQASYNFNRWLGFTADLGGYYGSPFGSSFHDFSYLFGPTFSYRTNHFTPFAHAFVGGNRVSASALDVSGSDTALAWAVGGGVDLPIHPLISIRAGQVDFLQTRHGSTGQNNVRVSVGVVFRLGHQ